MTGLGAITPLGNDVATTWEAALAGKSGAGPITHFDASLFKTQFACEVKNFNASELIPDLCNAPGQLECQADGFYQKPDKNCDGK